MNFFSSDPFLESLAAAMFPGKQASVETFRVDDRAWRLLVVDGRKVITDIPFLDFIEPLTGSFPEARKLDFLPRVAFETIPVEAWSPPPPGSDVEPGPFVDWSRFATWQDFLAWVGRNGWSSDVPRKRRKLERDLGPVKLTLHDPRPGVLQDLMRWKSQQYVSTGVRDLFRDPAWVRFFDELQRRDALLVTSLSAGDRVVAVHVGMRFDGRFYWWIPAYDPELPRYSPGKILLHDLMERSQADGDRVFDFLIGGEAYKFQYATDVRIVQSAGTTPLALRLNRFVYRQLKEALQKSPELEAQLIRLRGAVRNWPGASKQSVAG